MIEPEVFATEEDRAVVRPHVTEEYAGVLNPAQVERHLDDYLGYEIASQQVDQVLEFSARGRILDVGCGYGSFVLAARARGLDALGIDLSPIEIAFARTRLRRLRPDDDAGGVYRCGNGLQLPFPAESFDAVTLWNVLEHVGDPAPLLAECSRVLRRGGLLHVVCPNYATIRDEAHYHVLLAPLPRTLVSRYLRARGKDPRFFERAIFQRTNWGVIGSVHRAGLMPEDPRMAKLSGSAAVGRASWRSRILRVPLARRLATLAVRIAFYNPLRPSVRVVARRVRA